jgi:hypothetical protein
MNLVSVPGAIVQTSVKIFATLIYLKAFAGNEISGRTISGLQ